MNDTLNASYDTNLDTDFNIVMKLSGGKYGYQELINFLLSDKIAEKQFAALELNEIKSPKDAKILVSNLVGQDGKVREAVAFKINALANIPEYSDFFIDEEIFAVLLEGIMDINGNVCRQIVSGNWFNNEAFQMYLSKRLPESINKIWDEIEKIDLSSKQYVVSKRNFQLYWCLEALYNIAEIVNFAQLKDILIRTGTFYDYTIREKTAKILTKIDNLELSELKDQLKNDDNYYVRRYLNT